MEDVRAWAQLAEAEAVEADRNARFSDALFHRYQEQGLHRLLRPWRHGGASVRPRTFMEMVRTVAYQSVPAGWLFYFYPIHEAWVAYLPQNRQAEIYGSEKLVVDVFTPLGKVTPDGDGFRLSGESENAHLTQGRNCQRTSAGLRLSARNRCRTAETARGDRLFSKREEKE